MADKIIVRKGLKINLPALDEAELGFCTDTKELFIGSNAGNILINRSGTTQLANPTNLSSTAKTENSVAIAWTGVTGATNYDILVNSVLYQNVTGTSINVTGLSSNTAYTFTVRAKNATQSSSGIGISVTTSIPSSNAAIVTSGLTHYYNSKDGVKSGSVLKNLAPSASAQDITMTGGTVNPDGSIYLDGADYLGFNGVSSAYYNQYSKPVTIELLFKSRTATEQAAAGIISTALFVGNFTWADIYIEGIFANGEYSSGAIVEYTSIYDQVNEFHLTLTYNGSNIIMYRNGVAELNVPVASPISLFNPEHPTFAVLSSELDIAGFPSDFYLTRIYDRVLTDAEILQNYNAGKDIGLSGGGTTPTPVPTDPTDEGIVTSNLTVKTWVGGIE